LENERAMSALQTTVLVAIVSSIVATVIGTMAAIGIYSMKKSVKNTVMSVTYIPVLSPDIVTGVSLMLLFTFLRIPLNKYSLLLSHITFNIPYVIISVLPKLTQFNKNIYEVALDLGAKPAYAYWKVVVPEIMPGIVTGFLLAITLSVDDFVISLFTGGGNLSTYIYSQIKRPNPSINALSTLLFAVIFILLVVINFKKVNKEEKTVKNL
jgi:spermidine/putrescine transport system permease protein